MKEKTRLFFRFGFIFFGQVLDHLFLLGLKSFLSTFARLSRLRATSFCLVTKGRRNEKEAVKIYNQKCRTVLEKVESGGTHNCNVIACQTVFLCTKLTCPGALYIIKKYFKQYYYLWLHSLDPTYEINMFYNKNKNSI